MRAASTIGPGDVAPAPEDDVGGAAGEDAEARERCLGGQREGTEELDSDPARETRHGKRVELEPGFRNQPRLDAVGRPGEGHRHSAFAQRFRDGESRTNVACGPAGRDQAHELGRLAH